LKRESLVIGVTNWIDQRGVFRAGSPPVLPQPAAKWSAAATTTSQDLKANVDTIVRRHFSPNMPEEAAEKIQEKAT
jgi:hypothetical protein